MTTIAWDGRYMAADTRTFTKVSFAKEDLLTDDELAYLKERVASPTWHFANDYMQCVDGQRKIFVPTRKLFFNHQPVRAIGISGHIDAEEWLKKYPSGYDLMTPGSPFQDTSIEKNRYLIITDTTAFVHETGGIKVGGCLFLTAIDVNTFASVGAGYETGLAGKPKVISAQDYVNIACLMDTSSGGQIDVWDSVTGKLKRTKLYPFNKTMWCLRDFFQEGVASRRMLTKMETLHKNILMKNPQLAKDRPV